MGWQSDAAMTAYLRLDRVTGTTTARIEVSGGIEPKTSFLGDLEFLRFITRLFDAQLAAGRLPC